MPYCEVLLWGTNKTAWTQKGVWTELSQDDSQPFVRDLSTLNSTSTVYLDSNFGAPVLVTSTVQPIDRSTEHRPEINPKGLERRLDWVNDPNSPWPLAHSISWMVIFTTVFRLCGWFVSGKTGMTPKGTPITVWVAMLDTGRLAVTGLAMGISCWSTVSLEIRLISPAWSLTSGLSGISRITSPPLAVDLWLNAYL